MSSGLTISMRCWLGLLAYSAATGAAAVQVGRIGNVTTYGTEVAINTVLDMLEEMQGKSQRLQQEADLAYQQVQQVCESEEASRSSQVEEYGRQVDLLQASIAGLDLETEGLSADILAADKSHANASAWLEHLRAERQAEEAAYMRDLEEFTAAIAATQHALDVLSEQANSPEANSPSQDSSVQSLQSSLSQVSKLVRRNRQHQTNLLETDYTPSGSDIAKDEHIFDEFDSLSTATANYVAQTSTVEELLQSLLATFRDRKDELINVEKTNSESFQQLTSTLEAQIKSDRQLSSASRLTLAERQQEMSERKGELEQVYVNRNSTSAYLEELRSKCDEKESDHQKLSNLRAAEITAVGNAIALIENIWSSQSALLGTHVAVQPAETPNGERVVAEAQKVAGFLRVSAQRLQSQSLEAVVDKMSELVGSTSSVMTDVAGSLGYDPLAQVKQLIYDLIIRLQQEAAQESSHKAWCDIELTKNEAATSQAKTNINQRSAEVERLSADMEMLELQRQTAIQDLSATRLAASNFADQRVIEQANHQAIIDDATTAIEALNAAMSLITEYYNNVSKVLALTSAHGEVSKAASEGHHESNRSRSAALARRNEQTPGNSTEPNLELPKELTQAPVQAPSPEGGKSVLAMLEVIRDRYAGLEEEARNAEVEATQAEAETNRDHSAMVASLESDIRFFTQQHEATQNQLNATSELLASSHEALADAQATRESLRPPCLNVETLEEKAQRRQQEIDALREAEQMLDDFIAEYGSMSTAVAFNQEDVVPLQPHNQDVKQEDPKEGLHIGGLIALFSGLATKLNTTAGLNVSMFGNTALHSRLNFSKRLLIMLNASQHTTDRQVPDSDAPRVVKELLEEIRDEVQAQLNTDTAVYNQLKDWCTSAIQQMTQQIQDAEDRDKELVNTIAEKAYDAEAARTRMEQLQEELSNTQNSLNQRRAIRARQAEDFHEGEKELLESIVVLRNAIVVLESHYSNVPVRNLTQEREELEADKQQLYNAGGEVSDATTNLTLVGVANQVARVIKVATAEGKLPAIASSAEATEVLQRFVAAPQSTWERPGSRRTALTETGRSLQTPPSGEVVLGILQQLLATFQNDLTLEGSNEAKALAEFNSIEQSLLNQISILEGSITNKQTQFVEASRLLAQAKLELAAVREAASQDRAALQAVSQECLADDAEFERRNTTRSQEIATLNDAIKTMEESIQALEAAEAAAAAAAAEAAEAAAANGSTVFMLHAGRQIRGGRQHDPNDVKPRSLAKAASTRGNATSAGAPQKHAAAARPESIIKGYIASARKSSQPSPPNVASRRQVTMLSFRTNQSGGVSTEREQDFNVHARETKAALTALASKVDQALALGRASEPFTPLTLTAIEPVLAAITTMRSTLKDEKQLEIKMRDTCVSEKQMATLELEHRVGEERHKEAEIEAYKVTIDAAKTQIEQLDAQILIMGNALNASREQRLSEREQLQEEEQHQREYLQSLHFAVSILSLYYDIDGSAALVQLGSEASETDGNRSLVGLAAEAARAQTSNSSKPASVSGNGTVVNRSPLPEKPRFKQPLQPHGAGQGILAILRLLIEQTEAMIGALQEGEAHAMDAYAAGVTETTHSIEATEGQIVVLKQRRGDADARLQEATTALAAATAASDEVRAFIQVVDDRCTHLLDNFANNQAARQAEIDNLFHAKALLQGMTEQATALLLSEHRTVAAGPFLQATSRKGPSKTQQKLMSSARPDMTALRGAVPSLRGR